MGAMPFTLAQVSDSHLGARTTLFRTNFDRVAHALEAVRPDLVVASGDVSLDGADHEADLALAAAYFARLPAPVHAIPGNHDVGDHPDRAPKQPVNRRPARPVPPHHGPGPLGDRPRQLAADRARQPDHGRPPRRGGAGPDDREGAGHAGRPAPGRVHPQAVLRRRPRRDDVRLLVRPAFRPRAAAAVDGASRPATGRVRATCMCITRRCAAPVRYAWAPSAAFVVAPDEQPGLPGTRPCGHPRAPLHRRRGSRPSCWSRPAWSGRSSTTSATRPIRRPDPGGDRHHPHRSASASRSAPPRSCTMSRPRWRRASSCRWSARPAAARRRCCGSSPGWSSRMPGGS